MFCQGCSWRCGYCHNRHLQPFSKPLISWDAVLHFLAERKAFLDAVVFSGGEPTQQKRLDDAIQDVRDMGYKIGLHTAGVYPEGLKKVLPLIDWVGMDIKAPFSKYPMVTRVEDSGRKASRSVEILIQANISHEFRTTVDPMLLTPEDLSLLVDEIVKLGAKSYVIQPVRREGKTENGLMSHLIFDPAFLSKLGAQFEYFCVR
jgi:anaerobic ribonucleoside-triphosphate reductase activating protein